jgi:hypothetical protein
MQVTKKPFSWFFAWLEKRRQAKLDRELDKRVEVLLRKAKLRPPMTTEEQRAQARSFVRSNLALDGVMVDETVLAAAQRDVEAYRETSGLPYIRIKQ